MATLSLIADENVDRQIVALLRKEGHEVLYVAELDPGINDDDVLRQANERHALLLTADKDFRGFAPSSLRCDAQNAGAFCRTNRFSSAIEHTIY